MHKSVWAFLVTILVTVGGCASYPVNARLEKFDPQAGYRFKNLNPKSYGDSEDNPDELFVILAFSGGGTRAAALAYGVMQQLANTEIDGGPRTLLDEVDVISSVSGGSFTAAYYGLFREKLFDSFEEDFLKRDVQGALFWRFLSPWNLVRLASLWFSRIDIAAEYYDEYIFKNCKYADLVASCTRPFLIINSADMTYGMPFAFTQEQFDLLYSDLAQVPVARAVAASSAFPFLLTPLTLKNHRRGGDFIAPAWIDEADRGRQLDWRMYRHALQAKSFADLNNRPYVHLLDGGVAENLGVPAILHALTGRHSEWDLQELMKAGKVKRIVVIVVNANPDPDTTWDKRSYAPNVGEVVEASVNGLMDTNLFESAARLTGHIQRTQEKQEEYRFWRDLLVERQCNDTKMPYDPEPSVEFHGIEVSFGLIEDQAVARYFKNLPTTFYLPEEDVDCLKSAGADILRESGYFQKLLESLNATSPRVEGAVHVSSCR